MRLTDKPKICKLFLKVLSLQKLTFWKNRVHTVDSTVVWWFNHDCFLASLHSLETSRFLIVFTECFLLRISLYILFCCQLGLMLSRGDRGLHTRRIIDCCSFYFLAPKELYFNVAFMDSNICAKGDDSDQSCWARKIKFGCSNSKL